MTLILSLLKRLVERVKPNQLDKTCAQKPNKNCNWCVKTKSYKNTKILNNKHSGYLELIFHEDMNRT